MELALEHSLLANFTNETFGGYAEPSLIFGPKRDSLYVVVPVTIIYVVIFVAGVVGNVCTCVVIVRNRSMHTATNYYLFSLAVSDLLLLVSGLPQEVYWIWAKWPYAFGESFCVLRGLAAEASTNASVLTITSFTVERYVAICHPFLSHTMSKLSRAVRHILLVWLVALAAALPQALQFGLHENRGVAMCVQTRVILEHSFEISTFLFFFAPMVLITSLYALIGLRLSRSRIKRNRSVGRLHAAAPVAAAAAPAHGSRATPAGGGGAGSAHKRHGQSTRRVVKMLVAVVTAFFLCWAPFHAQRLVATYGTSDNHQARTPGMLLLYAVMTYCSGVMYYLSTAINPVLYHIMSNKFREAFKSTLGECCGGRGALRTARGAPYSPILGRRNAALSSTDNSGNSGRDETTRMSHAALRQQSSNKSLGARTSTVRNGSLPEPAAAAASKRCTCPLGTADNPAPGRRYRWNLLSCSANRDVVSSAPRGEAPPPPPARAPESTAAADSLRVTISNSSLREAEKRDLEDELNTYMEELQRRQQLR